MGQSIGGREKRRKNEEGRHRKRKDDEITVTTAGIVTSPAASLCGTSVV